MQLKIQVGARQFRVHEANLKIVGIEMQVAETRSQRGLLTYWRPMWRVGRPLRQGLLSVVAEAAQRLPVTLADEEGLRVIGWLVDTGRASVPAWVWPDRPPRQPKRKQRQLWRERRAEGGWPPRANVS